MGMKVTEVTKGTGEPGSYKVTFAETVVVTGKYTGNQEGMGPYLWLDTDTINGKKYSVKLGIGPHEMDVETLDKALEGRLKNSEITLKVRNITFQMLPHKPAYNGAILVDIVE